MFGYFTRGATGRQFQRDALRNNEEDMRILNRKEFLALDGQVLFAKYQPAYCGELQMQEVIS
jgi:hypothetical protein